jgi:predicted AAA+ superfamily ATPase
MRPRLARRGLLHALLNVATRRDVEGHPTLDGSWDGFIIDQVVQQLGVRDDETHYWRTRTGAELDLLVARGGRRMGFEVKRTTAPAVTPPMRSALHDLHLTSLTAVHAGADAFPLARSVRAVSAAALVDEFTR